MRGWELQNSSQGSCLKQLYELHLWPGGGGGGGGGGLWNSQGIYLEQLYELHLQCGGWGAMEFISGNVSGTVMI